MEGGEGMREGRKAKFFTRPQVACFAFSGRSITLPLYFFNSTGAEVGKEFVSQKSQWSTPVINN